MTNQRAARIAAECIKAAMKPLEFDANTVARMKSGSPSMIKHHRQYKRLAEALRFFEAMAKQGELAL